MVRMTRERLNTFRETVEIGGLPAHTVWSEYLARCWIPRRMFKLRLAKHELPRTPASFELQKTQSVPPRHAA
jgi:hypothetical protein